MCRAKYTKVCPECRRLFAFQTPEQVFCGFECACRSKGEFADKSHAQKLNCPGCKQNFNTYGRNLYCSEQCKNDVRDKKRTLAKDERRKVSNVTERKENPNRLPYHVLCEMEEKKRLKELQDRLFDDKQTNRYIRRGKWD